MVSRCLHLLILAGTLVLTSCGPSLADQEANAIDRQKAYRYYKEASTALDERRLLEAGDRFLRLQGIARSVERRHWTVFESDINVVTEAEGYCQQYLTAVKEQLPTLQREYLSSQVDYRRLDSFMRQVGVGAWEDVREPILEQARRKAEGEYRLVVAVDPSYQQLREPLAVALLGRAALNRGYGIRPPPEGRGTITLALQVESRSYPTDSGESTVSIPETLTMQLSSDGSGFEGWGLPMTLTTTAKLPSRLVNESPEAIRALTGSTLDSLTMDAVSKLAELPPLEDATNP